MNPYRRWLEEVGEIAYRKKFYTDPCDKKLMPMFKKNMSAEKAVDEMILGAVEAARLLGFEDIDPMVSYDL